MVNKTISLTDWTHAKLKGEINASNLIDRLLREHYKFEDKDLKKEKRMKRKIKEHKKMIQELINKQLEKEKEMGL